MSCDHSEFHASVSVTRLPLTPFDEASFRLAMRPAEGSA